MGCGASVQAGPFTQVVPVDEAELRTDKTQPCEPKQSFELNRDIMPETSKPEPKQPFAELKQCFLNVDIVPEPANAVSFKSYYFEPSADNCVPGRPVMPCAPSHRRHLANLKRMRRRFNAAPKELEVSIRRRRFLFDVRAKLRDSIQLEERERLRTLLVKEQQEKFEQQKASEDEHTP